MIGRKGLTQSVLVSAFERAGAAGVHSFISTGNVSFEADEHSLPEMLDCIGELLLNDCGLTEPIFVRPAQTLAREDMNALFRDFTVDGVYARCVTFLPQIHRPLPTQWEPPRRGDFEIVAVRNSEIYSVVRLIDGRPGNPGAFIEKTLSAKTTTRNVNTLERMLAKYL